MSFDHFPLNSQVYSLPTTHVNPKSFSEASLVDDSAVVLKADAVVVQGTFLDSKLLMSSFVLIISLLHSALISQGEIEWLSGQRINIKDSYLLRCLEDLYL